MARQAVMWFGLVFSICTNIFLGLEVAFNVYAIALKEAFNFTQRELELISGCGVAGMGASLVEPFITTKYGYKVGYLMIWIVASVSAFTMWLTVVFRSFFKHWPVLLCCIQFAMNGSQNAGSSRLPAIAILNLPARHTAKLVALYTSGISAAKLFYGGLFLVFFQDDLEGFFLCCAAIQAISIGICFFCHRPHEPGISQTQEEDPISESTEGRRIEDATFSKLLRSSYFHMCFWPNVVVYAILYTYINNITSIARSVNVGEPMYSVFILSVTVIVGRIIFGTVFDKFRTELCGFLILLTGSVSLIIGLALTVLGVDRTVFYVLTISIGIGNSVVLTTVAALISLRFGQHTYPYTIGCMYTITAILCLIFQVIVGCLYDQMVLLDGFCYGPECFRISSAAFLTIVILCLLAQAINYKIKAWEKEL